MPSTLRSYYRGLVVNNSVDLGDEAIGTLFANTFTVQS